MNCIRPAIGAFAVCFFAGSVTADPPMFLFEDVPYYSIDDSMLNATAFDFWVENFEDGVFDVPGVAVYGGVLRGPSYKTDSVDFDDGVMDGYGLDGWSWWVEDATMGVIFTFNPEVLNGWPTQVGLAWTDGAYQELVTFEAWDDDGEWLGSYEVVLGDDTNMGTTPEDRFFGVINHEGVSAIRVFGVSQSLEIDHLQYGLIVPDDREGRAFRTGFEPLPVEIPGFTLGDLSGQNGWMVLPPNAKGLVQAETIRSGLHALRLSDAEDLAIARIETEVVAVGQPRLVSSYDMFIPTQWARQGMASDRFEAQMRLDVQTETDPLGIEFGVMVVHDYYGKLRPGQTVFFIELTDSTGEILLASAYEPMMLQGTTDHWRNYRLEFFMGGCHARLFVDDNPMVELAVPFDPLMITSIQLQNQRWGTENDFSFPSEPLFFDNVDVLFDEPLLGDLNNDGFVDPFDLSILLGNWGGCPEPVECVGDLNGDGLVNATDVALLLGNWS